MLHILKAKMWIKTSMAMKSLLNKCWRKMTNHMMISNNIGIAVRTIIEELLKLMVI